MNGYAHFWEITVADFILELTCEWLREAEKCFSRQNQVGCRRKKQNGKTYVSQLSGGVRSSALGMFHLRWNVFRIFDEKKIGGEKLFFSSTEKKNLKKKVDFANRKICFEKMWFFCSKKKVLQKKLTTKKKSIENSENISS